MASLPEQKIVSRPRLAKIATDLRAKGQKIVTTNGSFDILHAGHVRGLVAARAHGDVLIVGLNSDTSVQSYKGPNRPINPEGERAYLLAALSCVDYVCMFDGVEIGCPLIELVRPHIHATGAQWGTDCPEAPCVKKRGAKLFLIPMLEGRSSSQIIDSILKVYPK